MSTLDLGFVGNSSFCALIDREARILWCCLPRFDGDPVFAALLKGDPATVEDSIFAIDVEGLTHTEQVYETNTAVLRTVLHSANGSVEVIDFAPRFYWRDRIFRPQSLVRRIRPIAGTPRVRIRVKPTIGYEAQAPQVTRGSNHIRFVGPETTLRLTTDAPIDYLLSERVFNLDRVVSLILGPDETLTGGVGEMARSFMKRTAEYWRGWSKRLAVPLEWQEAVVRAAITLKLCTYEPTGAIVAAVTTSIPEAPDSGRTWDYRYCWLRDAFFVVRALNSVGAVKTMEHYVQWLRNVIAQADGGHLQPVYGVDLEKTLSERIVDSLPGYRSMGPVRVGNQAYEHLQHDVYGNVILGAVQTFFDSRLEMPAGHADFRRLEAMGERAYALHDQPDAGMWELRSRAGVHTSSALMCWAACDRLSKIAARLAEDERAAMWRARSSEVRKFILDNCWSDERRAFVDSAGGRYLDASVLLMGEVGFIAPNDKRFVSTLERLEEVLADGPHMRRYEAADDFGVPTTAFNVCAFWRLDALARIGRRAEAREIFEALLACRNHLGLLSEDIDPRTGELWGNFPQTYSMVGIINGAMRLSRPWEAVV
ncbi:MAG TPA: glycoside hydrolase family 15 protein [Thermohalobaculum sp.]|nr:glycoside hydrolase family 15 protein [Thermohalobaculum sp.]